MASHSYAGGTFPDQDPAFQPQPSYDFAQWDEQPPRNWPASGVTPLRTLAEAPPGFQSLVGGQSDPDFEEGMALSAGEDLAAMSAGALPAAGTSSHIDPSKVWDDAEPPHASSAPKGEPADDQPLPPSVQHDIVSGRMRSVVEQYGQITPPDDATLESGLRKASQASQASSDVAPPPAKLNKSQRARNAAMQRHAKQKQQRHENGASEDDTEDKREKYREKNRLAAAKCRQKKKESVEGLEDTHRELSSTNKFLKQEARELRNELSALKTQALQHSHDNDPNCRCAAIHQYNRQSAERFASGASGSVAGLDWAHIASSPSEDLTSGGPSPGTLDPTGFGLSHSFSGAPDPMTGLPSRFPSFASQENVPVSDMHFSAYLQSSPRGGRPGFGSS